MQRTTARNASRSSGRTRGAILKQRLIVGLLAAGIALISQASRSDEGGVSFWLPGFFGSLAAAPSSRDGHLRRSTIIPASLPERTSPAHASLRQAESPLISPRISARVSMQGLISHWPCRPTPSPRQSLEASLPWAPLDSTAAPAPLWSGQ